jgi:hypothetical protein
LNLRPSSQKSRQEKNETQFPTASSLGTLRRSLNKYRMERKILRMQLKVLSLVTVAQLLTCHACSGSRTVVMDGGSSSNFMFSFVRSADRTSEAPTPRVMVMRVAGSDTAGVVVAHLSDELRTNIDVVELEPTTVFQPQTVDAGEEIIHGKEDTLTAGRMMLRHSHVNIAPEKTVSPEMMVVVSIRRRE